MDRTGGGQHEGGAIFLENDQPHPIAALVSISEQRDDGSLGGRHALGNRHRPGGIHHEQHQVGGLLYPHLALKIGRFNGECHLLALLCPFDLERSCSAQRGIESNIIGLAIGRAGLDVTAAFTLGVGT